MLASQTSCYARIFTTFLLKIVISPSDEQESLLTVVTNVCKRWAVVLG